VKIARSPKCAPLAFAVNTLPLGLSHAKLLNFLIGSG
jgi:hypothetical protein